MKNFLAGLPILLFVLLSSWSVGCSNESVSENTPNIPDTDNDSAVVLTEETTRYFTEVAENNITISNAIPETSLPKEGEIICCGITERTPDGYLGRVVDVKQTSNGYIVHTEQVTLDEAFETLSTDDTFDAGAAIESITDEEGVEYACTSVDASIWDEMTPEGNSASTRGETSGTTTVAIPLGSISVDGISLSGSLYLSARLDVKFDIDRHTLNMAHVEFSTRIGSTVELAAEYSGEYEKELKTFHIKLGRIPVAGGLVILHPTLKLSLVAGVSGEITAQLALSNEYAARSCYIHYENGTWTQGYEDRTSASGDRSIAASLEMSGELYTEARLGMLVGVYSSKIIGIGFDAAGKQALTGNFALSNEDLYLQNPDIAVDRTLSADFYFYARLFGKNLGRHEISTPELSLGQVTLRLFPEMEMQNISSADGTVSVESSWNLVNSLLAVEFGVALFDQDGNIEARERFGNSDVSNQIQQKSISFATDTRTPHFVAPYVRTQDDRYYYGKKMPTEEISIVGTWGCVYIKEFSNEDTKEEYIPSSDRWYYIFREDNTGEIIDEDELDRRSFDYRLESTDSDSPKLIVSYTDTKFDMWQVLKLTNSELELYCRLSNTDCQELVRFERIE